mgnify:CR=1 FL=1
MALFAEPAVLRALAAEARGAADAAGPRRLPGDVDPPGEPPPPPG